MVKSATSTRINVEGDDAGRNSGQYLFTTHNMVMVSVCFTACICGFVIVFECK